MKYMKFFQYAYIVFAVLFIYDAIDKWFSQGVVAYMSILLAATAIFMFFFKRRFNKKFENKDPKA